MSDPTKFDLLSYVVGIRLNEITAQQQRAATLAAADGVLIGFVASAAGGASGAPKGLILASLAVLGIGLVAATVAMWPATIPGLASENPAIEGNEADMLNSINSKLSGVLSGGVLEEVRKRRALAINVQLVAVGVALAMLLISAFLRGLAPAGCTSTT